MIVYFETPINPTSGVLDIAAIADRAHKVGAIVVVDGTFASPALQRPIDFGADLVLHSLTKYINGHGDVLGVGGAWPERPDREDPRQWRALPDGRNDFPNGGCLGDAGGLKTLSPRMERHGATGLRVTEMLEAHPDVEWVSYPYSALSHPRLQRR